MIRRTTRTTTRWISTACHQKDKRERDVLIKTSPSPAFHGPFFFIPLFLLMHSPVCGQRRVVVGVISRGGGQRGGARPPSHVGSASGVALEEEKKKKQG